MTRHKETHQFPREIDHNRINRHAITIIEKLTEHDFDAYLVGGCVRDLLLNVEPKDFDIATNAKPEEIRKIFRNSCRLIGRRFRLAHIRFGRHIIEVATFRGSHKHQQDGQHQAHSAHSDSGMILRDNIYGNVEEDAWRRDFSINALYYDVINDTIIDYTGGLQDLQARQLRILGDPLTRYQEDPVRMIRALRFSAKLDLSVVEDTLAPVLRQEVSLAEISPSRLFEEVIKLLHMGQGEKTFDLLRQYHLLGQLFPQTENCIHQDKTDNALNMITRALANTDARVRANKSVTPAFLCAVFLWYPLRLRTKALMVEGLTELQAQEVAMDDVIDQQLLSVSIPKRFTGMMREIWRLQHRFARRHGKRAWQLLDQRRFRAAYDFLLIRAELDQNLATLVDWWTTFQHISYDEQLTMVENLPQHPQHRKPKKEPYE